MLFRNRYDEGTDFNKTLLLAAVSLKKGTSLYIKNRLEPPRMI